MIPTISLVWDSTDRLTAKRLSPDDVRSVGYATLRWSKPFKVSMSPFWTASHVLRWSLEYSSTTRATWRLRLRFGLLTPNRASNTPQPVYERSQIAGKKPSSVLTTSVLNIGLSPEKDTLAVVRWISTVPKKLVSSCTVSRVVIFDIDISSGAELVPLLSPKLTSVPSYEDSAEGSKFMMVDKLGLDVCEKVWSGSRISSMPWDIGDSTFWAILSDAKAESVSIGPCWLFRSLAIEATARWTSSLMDF